MECPLLLRQEGGRLFVTFNRPDRRNALNESMLHEIERLLTRLEDDRSVRVVVFRGAGGHFCAGGDIRERREQTAQTGPADAAVQRNLRSGRMFQRLSRLPQTTVGVIEGYALGGGFGLACTFDIALALQSVQMGMSETRIGVAPAQIAPHVVRRIGLSNARYLALTGRRVAGSEALRLGIVHELAQTEQELRERLARLLEDIEACGPQACAVTKAIMNRVGEMPPDELIDYAGQRFGELNRGGEGAEGQQAFLEKRRPRWPGLEGTP